MAVRCGVDIVFIPGIVRILADEAVMRRFFDATELSRPTPEHMAGVLAAKEAFFKALGVKPKFKDVQVGYEPSGRPLLVVAPEWQTYKACDVSISHDQEYAIAMVLLT